MQAEIQSKLSNYPLEAQKQLEAVRNLIFSVAKENELGPVEETLKWGEASYRVSGGSTIRMDWKTKDPGVIKVFFHCQTTLVETFREIYPEEFAFEGQRAIVIPSNIPLNSGPLSHCIELALKYHSLKHLPLLGA